ncbi:hypothetical protein JZU46_04385 [bacterium]|nr:hypothetical protein [bacterium]
MNEHNEFGLFGSASLSGFLKAKLAAACARAECLTQADFLASSPDVLGNAIVESFAVTPLELHLDQMQRQQTNIEIAKLMDTKDYGNVVRREVMVPGYMMLFLIPFTGDAALWLLNNGPRMEPRGGRDALNAEQRILTLTLYNTCDVGSEWYQRQMEATMSEIDRQLYGQAVTLKQYHLDLAEAAGRAVARRGQQLQKQGA